MDVCLLWMCCQVEVSVTGWSLFQRSPTDWVRRWVWSRKLVEAMAHWGLSRQKQNKSFLVHRSEGDQRNSCPFFFVIKPTRCANSANLFLSWNSTCFGQFVCPSPGVYSMYTQQWYMSYRSVDSFRAGPLVLLESCLQTCMTYTIAECTLNKLLMMDRRTVRNM